MSLVPLQQGKAQVPLWVYLPLPLNEAPELTCLMKQKIPENITGRRTLFVSFNQNMENSVQPPQPPEAPPCYPRQSSGSTLLHERQQPRPWQAFWLHFCERAEKHSPNPSMGRSPGQQRQSRLTLSIAASPALFLAPEPSQGDPASAWVGSPPGPLNPHPGEVCNDEQSPQVSGRRRRVPEVVETLCKRKTRLEPGS